MRCRLITTIGLSERNGGGARRELEEHDAARVDVRARVELLAATLLGRHVHGRPREALVQRVARAHEREAEVADLHLLVGLAVVVLRA